MVEAMKDFWSLIKPFTGTIISFGDVVISIFTLAISDKGSH